MSSYLHAQHIAPAVFSAELLLLALACLLCAVVVACVAARLRGQIAPALYRALALIALVGLAVANVTLAYAVGIV